MKKLRLISLISAILCLVLVLAACGNVRKGKISDYLNTGYTPEDTKLGQSVYLSELDGYELITSNQYFAVFSKMNVSEELFAVPTTTVSYKLLSLSKGQVIATVAETNTLCEVELDNEAPIAVIAKTTLDKDTQDIISTAYTAYDAAGTQLATSTSEFPERYTFADLIVFNYVAYKEDVKTGALTKQSEVSEFAQLDDCDIWNDEYYYVGTDETLLVYDHSFKVVASWSVPSYAAESLNYSVLNDGKVFIQYTYALDSDAKKFDFYEIEEGETVKYDIVSLILNPEKNTVKEKECDVVISKIMSNTLLRQMEKMMGASDANNSRISDKFENIAIIVPIVDKKLDESSAACDIVLMDNNLNIKKSLKTVENQDLTLADKVADNLYAIELKEGFALVDEDSKIINVINNSSIELLEDYIVGETAIYNYDLTKAYDLIANDAEIVTNLGDSILVRANKTTGYDMILLYEGKQTTVYSYSAVTDDTLDPIPTTTFDYNEQGEFFCIHNAASGDYTYYNAENEIITTTQKDLEVSSSSAYGSVLLSGTNENFDDVYFLFTAK